MVIRLSGEEGRKSFHCVLCGAQVPGAGASIGVCRRCLVDRWRESLERVQMHHARSRERFDLPVHVPESPGGLRCTLCVHGCRMGEGERGYCGVRSGSPESFRHDGRTRALVSWYHDPLPTNCVADWVCPGGTGVGFPRFSHENGPEVGFYNLAVFFEACNLNCLYCQNWSFKCSSAMDRPWRTVNELVASVTAETSCVCFFGGDPVPQLPFALRVSERVLERHTGRIHRICWETNGSMHPAWLKQIVALSLRSGGCVKIDLKSWDPRIHYALCGCGNRRILENFARVARWIPKRSEPPLLVASTLLVPGYVGEEEVSRIAAFIAGLNPDIPYALLGFAPQFYMSDFSTTSREQADACVEAARRAGLRRVRLANRHLLC